VFGWQGSWRILPGNQSIVYLSSTEWNGRENLLIEFLDVFSKVYFVQLNIVSVSFLRKRQHTFGLIFTSGRI